MQPKHAWVALLSTLVIGIAGIGSSDARNTQYMLKIADVLKNPKFIPELPTDVDFYFANQAPPKAGTNLGDVEVKQKRRKPDQGDEQNCQTAMVAVLNELRDKAVAAGGNTVANLVSYYKRMPSGTETDYQCNAGASGGIVWLKGTILKTPR